MHEERHKMERDGSPGNELLRDRIGLRWEFGLGGGRERGWGWDVHSTWPGWSRREVE